MNSYSEYLPFDRQMIAAISKASTLLQIRHAAIVEVAPPLRSALHIIVGKEGHASFKGLRLI
jgi:hypothetical protein